MYILDCVIHLRMIIMRKIVYCSESWDSSFPNSFQKRTPVLLCACLCCEPSLSSPHIKNMLCMCVVSDCDVLPSCVTGSVTKLFRWHLCGWKGTFLVQKHFYTTCSEFTDVAERTRGFSWTQWGEFFEALSGGKETLPKQVLVGRSSFPPLSASG